MRLILPSCPLTRAWLGDNTTVLYFANWPKEPWSSLRLMAPVTTWHKFLSTRKKIMQLLCRRPSFLSHQILYSQRNNICALFQTNCANVAEYCCIVLVIFAQFIVQQCKYSQPNVSLFTLLNWAYYKRYNIWSPCLSFALRPRAERPCLPIFTERQHTYEISPSVRGLQAHELHGLTVFLIFATRLQICFS